ncbi:DNA-binding transcriptional LysR family regulator [Pseudonocardia sediminis]|uniref:DNA-binding transcriptional LysR family regulator n=1 Tax=Pseudonocardia sediminis TaxID=1397368 RepID=A0A4V2FR65_PSEST|nr:LysR family transcriptional regulator [Pseudonocardia sediminis]RZT87370.1 DNA-binding transcriptional LysR family regulator [Pseudonocardia sediminis]
MHDVLAPRMTQFVAVARTEHMTRAAERIGVPQPTLSRAMARLEADLGVALFTRTGRTLRLTPAGRTLLRRAEAALAELSAAADELAGDADRTHGRATLGFLSTLGTEAVPRLLRGFRDAHPGIRIGLLQGRHEMLLDRVREGGADLVLTSPLPDEPGLTAVALAEEELRLAVPSGHRLDRRAGTPDVDLAEAADEPFIGFAPGYGLRGTVDAWCRQAGFGPRIAFEGGDAATLRGLVGAGLGVALLPLAPDVPGVVQLPVRTPRTVRTLGMVHPRDDRPTPPVRELRAFVTAHAPHLLAPHR